MSSTNPRRSKGMTPKTPTCRKGATFHSPSSEASFTPPSLSRRSRTSLEDVVDEKRRRAALALEAFDHQHDASPSTSPNSYRDEGLPLPHGLLFNTINTSTSDEMDYAMDQFTKTNERKASLRPHRQTRRPAFESDSGLGTSINTKVSKTAAMSTITMSAAPGSSLQRMSNQAGKIVDQYILQKLLSREEFKDFHPIVDDCPRAIQQGEIVCIRDLEKTLTLGAPHHAKTAESFFHFCEQTITYIRTALTMGNLSEPDRTRPTDRPYTQGYFTDLVEQVRQAAVQIAASKEKEAKGEVLDDMDPKVSDEIKLHGGFNENGRPAELVRIKNGTAFSITTGEPIDMAQKTQPMKRHLIEDEEEVHRSMARRKKSATAAELAPKKCRQCGKSFPRPCDLTKHEKTHSRPFKCNVPDCKYAKDGWPTEKELLRHQNDRHSQAPKMYRCEFPPCAYSSKRESNAKQHMEKAHGWVYKRTKSNGKKKRTESSAAASTPAAFGLQTPAEELLDDFEDNNASVMYEGSVNGQSGFLQTPIEEQMDEFENGSVNYDQSVYGHNGFENHNHGSVDYGNSVYSPDNHSAPSNLSPNLSEHFDEFMPSLEVGNYDNSPNSMLRHGSTDSSIPSPYGGDNLSGFHLEATNGALANYPDAAQRFDLDFDLFAGLSPNRMHAPLPSYQPFIPDLSPPQCINHEIPQISPSGHGNHVLYTPTSLQAVDEGFEDYNSGSGGEDFPLFPASTTPNNNSRIPLFGEITQTPPSQDLFYPSYLNIQQEAMDFEYDPNYGV